VHRLRAVPLLPPYGLYILLLRTWFTRRASRDVETVAGADSFIRKDVGWRCNGWLRVLLHLCSCGVPRTALHIAAGGIR